MKIKEKVSKKINKNIKFYSVRNSLGRFTKSYKRDIFGRFTYNR